jgi:hypothetical protein
MIEDISGMIKKMFTGGGIERHDLEDVQETQILNTRVSYI